MTRGYEELSVCNCLTLDCADCIFSTPYQEECFECRNWAGNSDYLEDTKFALKCWNAAKRVRENNGL